MSLLAWLLDGDEDRATRFAVIWLAGVTLLLALSACAGVYVLFAWLSKAWAAWSS